MVFFSLRSSYLFIYIYFLWRYLILSSSDELDELAHLGTAL